MGPLILIEKESIPYYVVLWCKDCVMGKVFHIVDLALYRVCLYPNHIYSALGLEGFELLRFVCVFAAH